jgi:hypothetical protein
MKIDFKEILPHEFDANSRVWVYQSDRPFTPVEIEQIQQKILGFVTTWKSHGAPVKGYGKVLFGQFIILMADESSTGVSGCSTDTSIRFIKEIEKEFGAEMFDRQLLAFVFDDKVQLIPLSHINQLIESGTITPETLYFDNTILTKKDLFNNWIIPVKRSWISKRMQQLQETK